MAAPVQAVLRTAFVTKLAAALALDATFVANGGRLEFAWSSVLESRRERLWTHGAPTRMEPASLRAGTTTFKESGSFYVFAEVLQPGQGVEPVLDRCYDLAAIVASEAARHRTDLGVPGLQWITFGGIDEHAEGRVENGSGARVRMVINYEARLETP